MREHCESPWYHNDEVAVNHTYNCKCKHSIIAHEIIITLKVDHTHDKHHCDHEDCEKECKQEEFNLCLLLIHSLNKANVLEEPMSLDQISDD